MGMNDRIEDEKPKRGKRGATRNDDRLAALRASQGRNAGKADWSQASAAWLLEIVVLVASQGGAVRFGYSRDMGAYNVGIYLGGDSETLWFNGDADLDLELQKVWVALGGG